MVARKFTDGQLEAALRKHAGIKSFAAKELSVERNTVQERVDRSPHLQQVLRDIRENVVDLAEGVVVDALNKKDRETARWALNRLGKDRGYALKIENSVDPEQLETIATALARAVSGDVDKLRALRDTLDPAAPRKP